MRSIMGYGSSQKSKINVEKHHMGKKISQIGHIMPE